MARNGNVLVRPRGLRGGTYGAAGPAVRIDPTTGERLAIEEPTEDIAVTYGMNADGTLKVAHFTRASDARAFLLSLPKAT